MLQMWTIKLTESTNNFCASDRAVRTIKVNMKERFIESDGCVANRRVINLAM